MNLKLLGALASAVLVLAACSSSDSDSDSDKKNDDDGNGSDSASTDDCSSACKSAVAACSQLDRASCEKGCSALTASQAKCLGNASSCAAIESCDTGSGSSSGGGSSSSGGGSSSSSSGSVSTCAAKGEACSTDDDCKPVSKIFCLNGQSMTPESPRNCVSGACFDWDQNCEDLCTALGSSCDRALYGTCD